MFRSLAQKCWRTWCFAEVFSVHWLHFLCWDGKFINSLIKSHCRFVPLYIHRITEIHSYLNTQTAEFKEIEREAWSILQQSPRKKRQWNQNQTPFGELQPVLIDPAQLFQQRRPLIHLSTPVVDGNVERATGGCQCPAFNECPEGPRGREG
jgi:hypothetical protein